MFFHHLRLSCKLAWSFPNLVPPLSVCDSPAWLQLILTHEHADAILGLDNVRGVQPFNVNNDIPPTPVFVSQHTMDRYKAWDATWFWIVNYQLCEMILSYDSSSWVELLFLILCGEGSSQIGWKTKPPNVQSTNAETTKQERTTVPP